jgi:hypothetical protein
MARGFTPLPSAGGGDPTLPGRVNALESAKAIYLDQIDVPAVLTGTVPAYLPPGKTLANSLLSELITAPGSVSVDVSLDGQLVTGISTTPDAYTTVANFFSSIDYYDGIEVSITDRITITVRGSLENQAFHGELAVMVSLRDADGNAIPNGALPLGFSDANSSHTGVFRPDLNGRIDALNEYSTPGYYASVYGVNAFGVIPAGAGGTITIGYDDLSEDLFINEGDTATVVASKINTAGVANEFAWVASLYDGKVVINGGRPGASFAISGGTDLLAAIGIAPDVYWPAAAGLRSLDGTLTTLNDDLQTMRDLLFTLRSEVFSLKNQ